MRERRQHDGNGKKSGNHGKTAAGCGGDNQGQNPHQLDARIEPLHQAASARRLLGVKGVLHGIHKACRSTFQKASFSDVLCRHRLAFLRVRRSARRPWAHLPRNPAGQNEEKDDGSDSKHG